MMIRMNQRGEGKLGCIIGLLILVAAVFVAYKMIPVRVRATEFRDAVHDNARSAGRMSQAAIKKAIATKAFQLKIPVTENDINLQRTSDSISIKVDYVVPVEFPGYTYNWQFSVNAEYPVF